MSKGHMDFGDWLSLVPGADVPVHERIVSHERWETLKSASRRHMAELGELQHIHSDEDEAADDESEDDRRPLTRAS